MSASVTPSLLPSSSPNLESRLASRIQLTSDGFKVYVNAAIEAVADDIDYAQLVKYYGNEPEGQKRYSPATHKGAEKIIRLGDPDPRHVGTIYVERHNLSVVCRYKLSITKKGHTGVEMFQGLFSFLPLAPKPYHAAQANLALPNRASLKDITAQTTRSLLSTLYVKVLSSKVAHYRRQLGLRTDPALLPLSNGRSLHFPAGKAGSVLRGTFGMMLREAPNGQTIPREASFTSMCIPFFAFASSAWLGRAWGPRGAPPPSCARPINQENLAIDLYAPSPRARRHPACTCSSSPQLN